MLACGRRDRCCDKRGAAGNYKFMVEADIRLRHASIASLGPKLWDFPEREREGEERHREGEEREGEREREREMLLQSARGGAEARNKERSHPGFVSSSTSNAM